MDRVKEIVKEFPDVGGFGIGTKLSSEVKAVAGVIFKQCVMKGRPTLKASNSEEKITLPGRLQLFRGSDARGMYAGDVIGLDDEEAEIPGAVRVSVCRCLSGRTDNTRRFHRIREQKIFVEEQRRRFEDIENYPRQLSTRLREATG